MLNLKWYKVVPVHGGRKGEQRNNSTHSYPRVDGDEWFASRQGRAPVLIDYKAVWVPGVWTI
jgi:hypothetical protein